MTSSAEPDPDQLLEFRILGPLEVWRAGSRLALGGRQQRAVLAILLCDPDASVSVDRLADALWGESPPGGYLTTLQTYVFHLRAALEPGRSRGAPSRVLATEPGGGYRLHLDGALLDATTFEQMAADAKAALDAGASADAVALYRRALDLWRGDVLADLADVEVVGPVAARLDGMRVAAFENLFDAELALRRHAEVLPELERLVTAHPLRERVQAQLILALYRSGRQAEALNAYNDLRSTLRDELGIDPSPPLQELYSAVLAQDSALLDQTPAAVAAPPSEPPSEPPTEPPRRRPTRRTTLLTAGVAVVVATTVATTAHFVFSPSSAPKALAANSLGEIGANGEVRSSVPVGTDPVGVAYAGDALWVANRSDKTVSRVDPKSGAETRVVRVGGAPESLAVTAHDIWVANRSDDTVSRINVTAAEVVDTIAVGDRPAAIAAGPSGVWVANSGANTIQRIDPTTGAVDAPIEVGDGPDGIAVDHDSVWVANGRASTVWRINPSTRAHRAIRVGDGPRGISVVGDEVWVANQLSQSVTRISRSTERARFFVLGDGPAFVAAVGGSVWVSEQYEGALTRVDRASGRVDRFAVNGSPRGLAAVGDRLWVAAGAFSSAAHRGGTLTFASSLPPGDVFGIDPSNAYDPETTMLERLVYDGLVTLASSGDFPVLVPDLATSLPSPSKGGTVYTFTLRPGIRYSNGRPVRASDFVLSVRRALAHGERSDFYEGIVGAGACRTNPSGCDLARGVQVDDANGTVTFVLAAPDPEFLYKLTMFIFPVPPGTPLAKTDVPPVGTGPYRIAEYTPKKSFELRRNTFFRQWSFAAQPAGYPDAIRWLKVPTKEAAAAAVTEGRADLTLLTPIDDRPSSGALVERIHKANPLQVHTDALPALEFEVLGTKGPPFNNLKVRQALNYAVDRNVLVDRYGGPSVALPTCQLVPASLPGFQWHCPYTVGPDDGKYHGPDPAKARRLVAESGTRGASVTVHYVGGGIGPPFDDYLVDVLNQLGYHARLQRLPNNDASNTFIYNGDPHFQATNGLWITDYPLVSNLYYGVIACGAYAKQYCNPQLDQQAAQATVLQETDPAAALRAWAEVDRQVVEAAAIVPGTNALDSWYTSARTGNYQVGPLASPLIGQLWVQ